MYKTDVVKRVAREQRLPQHVVSDVIGSVHRLIEETLRDGGTVSFPGFGTFARSHRKGGKGLHVKKRKLVDYPARTVAVFRVGAYLKNAVAGKRRR
jgi:nucleoid DNA-binding protein